MSRFGLYYENPVKAESAGGNNPVTIGPHYPGAMKIYKQRFKCVSALFLVWAANLARLWASPADVLEKAIYAEETKGELAAASELYRQVVNEAGADRALAAQAQVRLGLCELKLGNKPQAITQLEQLRTEFPDKARLLAILEQQMPSLLDEILKQIVLLCAAGLFVSLLMLTYGIDLSPGLF